MSQKRKTITLKDVAQDAGVSINTASWVLNPRTGNVSVSPTTRIAVLNAARKLGYHRNAAAASLAGSSTKTLGILMSSLANPFEATICDAFEERAADLGYQCFVGCTRFRSLRKVDYITKFLSHGVDGLLLATVWKDPEVEFALKTVVDRQMPLAFLDFIWEDRPAPLICGNHFQGGQLLARHLLDVGHRRMAFLCHDAQRNLWSATERIRGIQDVLEACGDSSAHLEILYAAAHRAGAFASVVQRSLQQPEPPSVILCAGDLTAVELCSGLAQLGIKIPDEVCITGYDDLLNPYIEANVHLDGGSLPWDTFLTTIRQPVARIGRKAADVLIGQIDSDANAGSETHLLNVELVVSSSSYPSEKMISAGRIVPR